MTKHVELMLTISSANDVFQHGDHHKVVAGMLLDAARQIEHGDTYRHVMDENGNTVGQWGLHVHEDDGNEQG